jgi:DNA repair protein REV1
MMEHGGVYHHYYSSRKTTHIIASNLPDVKVRQLKGHELIVKVNSEQLRPITLIMPFM